jgi:hypothetical protein
VPDSTGLSGLDPDGGALDADDYSGDGPRPDGADADSDDTAGPNTGPRSTAPNARRGPGYDQGGTGNRSRTGTRGQFSGFDRAGGYYVGYQPPVQLGTGAATAVWGSLVATAGKSPDRNTGEMRSPWYLLPPTTSPDQAVAVLLAGSPNQGNSLEAEYAEVRGDRLVSVDRGAEQAQADPAQTGTQSQTQTAAQRDPAQRDNGQLDADDGRSGHLDDTGRDPRWRSVLLRPPAGAQLVRLHAVDDSAGAGGWLAFAAPAVQRLVPLRSMLDRVLDPQHADRAAAVAWQIAFQYPCLRQSEIRDGITEPPSAAVLWGEQPFFGTRDGTWLAFRGGIHGQVLRSQSALQLTARVRGMPAERRAEVLVFDTALAPDAYLLTTDQRRTAGWSQPVPTATRTSNELERCVQTAAGSGNLAAGAKCVPKPVP